MKKYLLIVLVIIFGYLNQAYSQATAMREAKKDSVVGYEYPFIMPILGQKVADKGFKLPLPMGIMVNAFVGNQNLAIDNLEVGFNDSPMYSLDSIVEFDEAVSSAFTINTRIDTWIFPFWGLYFMGGYSAASTEVNIIKPVEFSTNTESQGYYVGFGSTLAFGIRGFFASLDGSYIWNYQDLLEKPAKVLTTGIRTGPIIRFKKHPDMNLVPWVGVLFTNLNSETVGKIKVSEVFPDAGAGVEDLQVRLDEWYNGLTPPKQNALEELYNDLSNGLTEISEDMPNSTISYSMQKTIEQPFNMIVGGQWQINQRYQIRGEAQFLGDRAGGLISFNYRFGIKGKNFLAGTN